MNPARPACGPSTRDHAASRQSQAVGRRAARIVTVLLLVGLWACAVSSPPAQPPVAAPEPIGPRGPTELPFVFSWKAVPGQPIYRVRVTDAAERVLYEQEVRNTQCRPSNELKSMMGDRATFTWTVGVLSPDGAGVVARSAPIAFSLK
jgi:hypothetical protein